MGAHDSVIQAIQGYCSFSTFGGMRWRSNTHDAWEGAWGSNANDALSQRESMKGRKYTTTADGVTYEQMI